MRLVIVGAGGIARELLRGLSDLWNVAVIDPDPERLALAQKARDAEPVEGDGSSRLVLEKAGLAETDALIAASDNDDVNIEACRLAKEAGVSRLVAVAAEPERLGDYRSRDIPAFSSDRLTARRIELTLEPRRVSSATFAEGKAEAVEFLITADSPVQGKTLAELHSEIWLVVAILRDGELIVPHGGTVIQKDDLVTAVGAAEDYSAIVRSFTQGTARFPIDFGRQIAVGLNDRSDLDGPVAEAINLTRHSLAEGLLLIHPALEKADPTTARMLEELIHEAEAGATGVRVVPKPINGPVPASRVAEIAGETSAGVVVVPAPSGSWFQSRLAISRLLRTMTRLGKPVLFSRGAGAYDRVLVPARNTAAGRAASRAAIDIAAQSKALLVGVAVVPPSFMAREESPADARHALDRLHEEASVLGVSVKRRLRQGNPARVIEALAGPGLVVLALPSEPLSPFRPTVAGHVVANVPSSVLLVPIPERK